MASERNDVPNRRSVTKIVQEEGGLGEDEINLIDYLRVLWKRKCFIAFGSVLPTIVVGLIFFFWPRSYKVTYSYDIRQNKRDYNLMVDEFYSAENLNKFTQLEKDELLERGRRILLDRFYSAENLDRLTAELKKDGFDEYAQTISKANIQLDISGTSLDMTIIGRSQIDMQRISSIVRDNFEEIIPMYSVKDELSRTIAELQTEMVNIEENRYSQELELERKRAVLTKLKNLEPAAPNENPGGIVLHFDNVSDSNEYLPLAYQVQAVAANIINFEETIKANQEKYNYYKDLLNLNKRLFDEIKNNTSSYYDIREFHSFLRNIISDYEDKELKSYLNAYIKTIENTISTNTPVVEKPRIYPVPKGTINKSAVVFMALLMVTTISAFLLEAVQKSRTPAL